MVSKIDALIMEKREETEKQNLLIPNIFVEADGAFRDGNVPAAVGRPRFDRGHRWFGCDPKAELTLSAS